MNEFCEFPALTKWSKCIACGYALKLDYEITPVRPCVQRCKHQSDKQIDTALIKCETCQGNVRLKFQIHECAIFGKCLPTFSGVVDDGHGCIGCERREVSLPEQPA